MPSNLRPPARSPRLAEASLRAAHRLLRRGYAPPRRPVAVRGVFADAVTASLPAGDLPVPPSIAARVAGGLVGLCPTYVGSMPADRQVQRIAALAAKNSAASAAIRCTCRSAGIDPT